jgi:hypothetical protein
VAPFMFLLFLLWLILLGPGRASLDYLASRWLGLERGRSAESDARNSATRYAA